MKNNNLMCLSYYNIPEYKEIKKKDMSKIVDEIIKIH